MNYGNIGMDLDSAQMQFSAIDGLDMHRKNHNITYLIKMLSVNITTTVCKWNEICSLPFVFKQSSCILFTVKLNTNQMESKIYVKNDNY